MKKTNKKGFTLVELLAVIVILGVLLMIAVPGIQAVIANSQRKSFESAAKLAIENVETLASAEKVSGNLSPCYVLIAQTTVGSKTVPGIELERGSFGKNAAGYIYVDELGKGRITITNDTFSIPGKTLAEISREGFKASSATSVTIDASVTGSLCAWYY